MRSSHLRLWSSLLSSSRQILVFHQSHFMPSVLVSYNWALVFFFASYTSLKQHNINPISAAHLIKKYHNTIKQAIQSKGSLSQHWTEAFSHCPQGEGTTCMEHLQDATHAYWLYEQCPGYTVPGLLTVLCKRSVNERQTKRSVSLQWDGGHLQNTDERERQL